jgi:hypothetical protein
MKIVKLDDTLITAYDNFVRQIEHAGFFYSNIYRMMLKDFINAEDNYFVLINDSNEISAVLPSFLKKNSASGYVLNSLPFYGSNGGILSLTSNEEDKLQLLKTFINFAEENNCISSTIICSPFEEDNRFYEMNTGYNYKDERIGQLTYLPVSSDSIENDLMGLFHQKTRNMVRKAGKINFYVSDSYSDEIFDFLYNTHKENIESLGGIAKGSMFFDSFRNRLQYGTDYKIFSCKLNNNPVSALLLFYFNRSIEYFTPVIKKEFRNLQPLTLLIYRAMIDACSNGYKYWNWGGTWISQNGVYLFKSRWGTIDKKYYYYIKLINENALNFSREQLLKQYPYFYVLPFNALNRHGTA